MAEIKSERTWEWMQRWGENEWGNAEWRQFIISLVRDAGIAQDKLNEIEPLYEEQGKYIKYLERQLELLQKTLDIAEKFSRPIILPGDSGVIK
jgi:hypothetical protein